MSDDNNNSDPFDFDFNALSEEEPLAQSGDSAFDLDNPFGDDIVVTRSEAPEPLAQSEDSFDLDNPFGDDLTPPSYDAGVSEDNPHLNESSVILPSAGLDSSFDVVDEPAQEKNAAKKKGFMSGIFGGKKDKAPKVKPTKEAKQAKEKPVKEKQPKPKKEKKEKAPKEAKEKAPAVPRDWGTILCIAFSVFLLASLLTFNVATFLTAGDKMMETLCFLAAFNLVGLALVAVPVLFYKFPRERTLPNVLLGISTSAIFTGVLFHVCNAYHYYGFAIRP